MWAKGVLEGSGKKGGGGAVPWRLTRCPPTRPATGAVQPHTHTQYGLHHVILRILMQREDSNAQRPILRAGGKAALRDVRSRLALMGQEIVGRVFFFSFPAFEDALTNPGLLPDVDDKLKAGTCRSGAAGEFWTGAGCGPGTLHSFSLAAKLPRLASVSISPFLAWQATHLWKVEFCRLRAPERNPARRRIGHPLGNEPEGHGAATLTGRLVHGVTVRSRGNGLFQCGDTEYTPTPNQL